MTQLGYPDLSPHAIERPKVVQQWHDLAMLHWRAPAAAVAATLPAPLQLDTFDGEAWLSLVPFRMVDVTAPPVPPVPGLSTFEETNVRTYVVGPEGPAVWFYSLDVPRALVPPATRLSVGVPYSWARMAISLRGDEIRYSARRRWPAPRGASSLVGVEVGERRAAEDLDRWLTNRWGAYSRAWGRLWYTPVRHSPWGVREAAPTVCRDELAAAAGFPLLAPERVIAADDVVEVAFDLPRPVA